MGISRIQTVARPCRLPARSGRKLQPALHVKLEYGPDNRPVEDEADLARIRSLAIPPAWTEKVLAIVVRLLETTYIRVGNEEYARTNKSFGLTTLQNRHVNGYIRDMAKTNSRPRTSAPGLEPCSLRKGSAATHPWAPLRARRLNA